MPGHICHWPGQYLLRWYVFRYEWDPDRQSHYDFLGNWHNVTSHLAIHIFLRFIGMIKIPTLAMQLKTICYQGLWLLYHLNVSKVEVAATRRGGSCLCTSISITFQRIMPRNHVSHIKCHKNLKNQRHTHTECITSKFSSASISTTESTHVTQNAQISEKNTSAFQCEKPSCIN